MVTVRPFRGLRYSINKVSRDLSNVICPPYDVISFEQQSRLRSDFLYNAINLELPEGETQERYEDAYSTLRRWQSGGILERDLTPKYYLLKHEFSFGKKIIERWGITAAVRLEDYRERLVLPHEETGFAAKEDRFNLMKTCHANFSPIMSLFRDDNGKFNTVRRSHARKDPVAVASYGDESFMMWTVEGNEAEEVIGQLFDRKPLFIADGHHRYETAMRYKEWLQSQTEYWNEDNAANFVMMTLIEFDDPGLMILPYHRTLGHIGPILLDRVRNRLREFFEVEPISTQIKSGRELERIVEASEGVVIGVHDEVDGTYLLRFVDAHSRSELCKLPGGDTLSKHGAWVLQQILEQEVGSQLENLEYSHDPEEVWHRVYCGEQAMGFYLNAFPLGLFESVVSMGQKLPRKSTYFYPKLPTGVVFNLLNGKL
ncbi:MAG: Uncharacterized conserved protein, DUF1015 family/Uncharacterized conserved protein, DUF1015 family [Chloroflexi bacterium]|jgi:uncharacterized protein (DUF1015 family)|nr:MAG: Uncharacterized conserved protein, DUF1015 family/Uncharacterized conserved protein, DUF1015 family [Chloroflexota bacterium]